MLEAHRVKNGCNQWNRLPPGYKNLERGDRIQAGDVIRMNDEYFSEYQQGLLIGTVCGAPHIWFRKSQPDAKQGEAV